VNADEGHSIEYEVPRRLRVGVYANAAQISYSAYEFTIDWAVLEQGAGEPGEVSHAIVCSRVRIPVSLVFGVLQGINRAMTYYEAEYGEIRRPDE
jgi:Protein of unknown function (DUF3467)